jgi:hypothetical protein
LILRNEAKSAPADPVGGTRHAEDDATKSHAAEPRARWSSQLDPSHPSSDASQCDDRASFQENQANDAPHARQDLESECPSRPAAHVERDGGDELATNDMGIGPNDDNEPANADKGNRRGDEPNVPRAAVPPLTVTAARLAELLVPMDRAALALLTDAELKARRWAMFQAKRKFESRPQATVGTEHDVDCNERGSVRVS